MQYILLGGSNTRRLCDFIFGIIHLYTLIVLYAAYLTSFDLCMFMYVYMHTQYVWSNVAESLGKLYVHA